VIAEKVKERPIIFIGDSPKWILEDRKTQTRRIINPQPEYRHRDIVYEKIRNTLVEYSMIKGCWNEVKHHKCPYGKVGDRLWVRETFCSGIGVGGCIDNDINKPINVIYKADSEWENQIVKWSPSIHMPRGDSRINLEITNIGVQRIQDISDYDIRMEGIDLQIGGTLEEIKEVMRNKFSTLWDSKNKKRGYGWLVNPYVWGPIEFKRIVNE